MTSISSQDLCRELRAGQDLDDPGLRRLWRVRSGVIAVARNPAAGGTGTHYLARPGDLLGAELLVDDAPSGRVFALTAVQLQAVSGESAAARRELLAQAYRQARRQADELLRLRTGSLTDRVRQMLMLLGGMDEEEAEVELPPLRQQAELLDASQEAICRVLGGMRQLEVLVVRPHRRARVVRRALRDLVPPRGISSGLPPARTADLLNADPLWPSCGLPASPERALVPLHDA